MQGGRPAGCAYAESAHVSSQKLHRSACAHCNDDMPFSSLCAAAREVTKYSNVGSSLQRDVSCWTDSSLREMQVRRQAKWEALVAAGRAPAWLAKWLDYCQEVPASEAPDYRYLRRLIDAGEEQEVARRLARPKAELEAWGAWPEE